MSRELVRRGWEVTIAASDFHLLSREYTRRVDADDRTVIEEDLDEVALRYLWSAPYTSNDWRRAWNWLTFARSLLQWSPDRGRPDVIIGSSPHLFAALAGLRMSRRWSVPFVFEVRDLWPESMVAAGGSKGIVYAALKWIADHLYRHADGIVCLSRGTRTYLHEERSIPEEKLYYVPNGVDPEAFAGHRSSERTRTTFVYTGAHGPANGLDAIIDAADRLRERRDVSFQLVGDGPAKSDLKRQSTAMRLDNVAFLDPVPKEQIPDVLSAADAGLMVLRETPLFSFGVSPNKLFDYMGAALPVVCNVPGEVEAMVREAGAGVQAASGSGEDLAAAVTRLADRTSEERATMGQSGREWVSREHGRKILAERLDGILRDLVR